MGSPTQQVLAFDFGLRHIGVAAGQSITATASCVTTLKANHGTPDWAAVEDLIQQWQPQSLIVGLPLNMDDTESDMSARAREFGAQLRKRLQLEVIFVDERLSSREARAHSADHHGSSHELAAIIIAESYLSQL